jgi:hypothetical protein
MPNGVDYNVRSRTKKWPYLPGHLQVTGIVAWGWDSDRQRYRLYGGNVEKGISCWGHNPGDPVLLQ